MTDLATAPETAQRTVDDWLRAFNAALEAEDAPAAARLFATDAFLRDLVALTWNIKTLEGRDEIEAMLAQTLGQTHPRWFATSGPASEADGVVDAWLEFETAVGRGRGHLRLRDGSAWTLLTTLYELKGHEEPRGPQRPMGAEHGVDPDRESWLERRQREAAELGYETQP